MKAGRVGRTYKLRGKKQDNFRRRKAYRRARWSDGAPLKHLRD